MFLSNPSHWGMAPQQLGHTGTLRGRCCRQGLGLSAANELRVLRSNTISKSRVVIYGGFRTVCFDLCQFGLLSAIPTAPTSSCRWFVWDRERVISLKPQDLPTFQRNQPTKWSHKWKKISSRQFKTAITGSNLCKEINCSNFQTVPLRVSIGLSLFRRHGWPAGNLADLRERSTSGQGAYHPNAGALSLSDLQLWGDGICHLAIIWEISMCRPCEQKWTEVENG